MKQENLDLANSLSIFTDIKESVEQLILNIPFSAIADTGEIPLGVIFTLFIMFYMPKFRGGGILTLSTIFISMFLIIEWFYLKNTVFTNGVLSLEREPLSIIWIILFLFLGFNERVSGIDNRSTTIEATVLIFLIDLALGFGINIFILLFVWGGIALSLDEVDATVGIADLTAEKNKDYN